MQSDIAAIRTEIATRDLDRQARGGRIDGRWYHRAKTALRFKQQQVAAITAHMANLPSRRDALKDQLIEVLRADYDDDASAILSSQIRPEWVSVSGVSYHRHEKPGSPPSLRVEYACGLASHREWVCFEHTGYARQKAVQWWQTRLPDRPVLISVDDALNLSSLLPKPERISVRPQGRYTEITGYELQKCSATSAAARPAASAGSIPPSRSTTPGSGFATSAPSPARTSAMGDTA